MAHTFVDNCHAKGLHCCRGYWTDIDNVRKELQTLIANKNLDRHTLPSNKQLRELGANQLCNAIEYHGGFAQAADKLGYILCIPYIACACCWHALPFVI